MLKVFYQNKPSIGLEKTFNKLKSTLVSNFKVPDEMLDYGNDKFRIDIEDKDFRYEMTIIKIDLKIK